MYLRGEGHGFGRPAQTQRTTSKRKNTEPVMIYFAALAFGALAGLASASSPFFTFLGFRTRGTPTSCSTHRAQRQQRGKIRRNTRIVGESNCSSRGERVATARHGSVNAIEPGASAQIARPQIKRARPTHLGVVELELGLERGGLLVEGLLGLLAERLPSNTGGAADLGNILVVRVGQLVLGTGTFTGERSDRKTVDQYEGKTDSRRREHQRAIKFHPTATTHRKPSMKMKKAVFGCLTCSTPDSSACGDWRNGCEEERR
jgi:hypothetical protein